MKATLGGAASTAMGAGVARPNPFTIRLAALVILLAAEMLVFSLWLDGASIAAQSGLVAGIREWGAFGLRFAVGFAAVLGILVYARGAGLLAGAVQRAEQGSVRLGFALAHAVALGAFGLLSQQLYGGGAVAAAVGLAWLGCGAVLLSFAALACFELAVWAELARALARLMAIAGGAALAAAAGASWSRELWGPSTRVTFWLVQHLLAPVLAIRAEPAARILRAPGFAIRVAPECSGLEGAGLMLVFGVVWLWLFRAEYRFPRAFLLLPVGIAAAFALNVFRIAALLWLGSAGAKAIAAGGFHSQAGWIAFNMAAFGFAVAARKVNWLCTEPVRLAVAQVDVANPVAPFLVPFLGILAAGLLATAASAGFEWLYPLRLLACVAALWVYREHLRVLDWRVSWAGPAAGGAVFLLWIGVDHALHGDGTSAMPVVLSDAPAGLRVLWIAVRALAAAVTVPVAEELAFRGFLMRRLVSADFEAVDARRVGWLAMVGSAIAFGLMHGALWPAGIAAGVVYGLVYWRRGSIGEAALAHGVTNALLAVYVVLGEHWRLW